MANNTRKRGGTFHMDGDEGEVNSNVQFMTPYFDGDSIPEPLDLSKLCLDDDDEEDDEDDLYEKEKNDEDVSYSSSNGGEDLPTRGRSRSRSICENDDAIIPPHPPAGGGNVVTAPKREGEDGNSNGGNTGLNRSNSGEKPTRRTSGPLAHREVQALKKGLEEANQSLNSNQQTREDEEERMAADAEKRKRLLLSSSSLSAGSDAPVTRRAKILMLGDSGVGKSSLILRWTMDTFSPSLVSTVGVNFKSRRVTVGSELVQVQVWDTAGQEQFHKITTSYYKGAQGIMLVYDVTDKKTMENIEYWIKNIKSHASDAVQVALIGNKTDIRSGNNCEEVGHCTTAMGQEIATKFGIPFQETSAKESFNVDMAFVTLTEHIVSSGGGAVAAIGSGGGSSNGGNGGIVGAGDSYNGGNNLTSLGASGGGNNNVTAGNSTSISGNSPTNRNRRGIADSKDNKNGNGIGTGGSSGSAGSKPGGSMFGSIKRSLSHSSNSTSSTTSNSSTRSGSEGGVAQSKGTAIDTIDEAGEAGSGKEKEKCCVS